MPAIALKGRRPNIADTKSDQSKRTKVVALVPAHNEEGIIRKTIESLINQTHTLEFILVIADNCTDSTVQIVEELQHEYGKKRIRLLSTVGNTYKKAGALNQGMEVVPDSIDYVFSMDADTILHPKIIGKGVEILESDTTIGGVCSAYRTLPPKIKGVNDKWGLFLWRLQNIEFAMANAWRIENYKSARVLPGVSVLYRMGALKSVQKTHPDNTIWATDSLVEDYKLTLELKDLGWKAKSSQEMIAWSDWCSKFTKAGGLWGQRTRWYSGTVDDIRPRKFKEHSRYEVFSILLLMWSLLTRILLLGVYIAVLAVNQSVQILTPFLLLPVVTVGLQFYRLRYGDQIDKWQKLMTATLICNEAYAFWREIAYAYSIWLSYRRPNRGW